MTLHKWQHALTSYAPQSQLVPTCMDKVPILIFLRPDRPKRAAIESLRAARLSADSRYEDYEAGLQAGACQA